MRILGLTGSIGMGKTTAASVLRRLKVPVHDADAAVHRLSGKGGAAVAAIEAAFPGVVKNGAVDRLELGRRVFGDPAALAKLEAILHPLVRRGTRRFLARARAARRPLVVLDVPLLFETGGEARCDAVLVVSAPRFVQRARVLARPGMTEERLAGIEARQMPDGEKRRRADYVVPTGLDRRTALRAIRRALKLARESQPARRRSPHA
ncbi:MAG: dephospho-CoA kinase [Alphaproteobacteria bacterium]|nr:MAG: dephospho-CoA kinase [Alphaproteobacteria bacterium]